MSRTLKDRPYRVRVAEAYKSGRIEHEHAHLGLTYEGVRKEKTDFPKSDAAAIYKFRSELVAAGLNFTEEERPARYVFKYKSLYSSAVYEMPAKPKRIRFIVEVPFSEQRYSSFCTDYEHFDSKRGVDTRDGFRAVCSATVPETKRYGCTCAGCNPRKSRYSKAKRDAKLSDIKKAFNGGDYDFDDLDDLDAPAITEESDRKVWID